MRSNCSTEAVSRILDKTVVTDVVTQEIWPEYIAISSPPISTEHPRYGIRRMWFRTHQAGGAHGHQTQRAAGATG